ncbi:MAG: hypothetical protein CM15mP22_0760 [Gammaproteobacteria bacterium]|nr:MAG: hypothetical protein CM15mP22_0760 [Gammaproteobacteria bacterium]
MIISGKSLWKAKENLDSENIDIEKAILNSWPKILKIMVTEHMTGKWHVNLPVNKLFDIVKDPKPGMPSDNGPVFYKQVIKWKEESNDLRELSDYMPSGYGRPTNEKDNSWSPTDSIFGGFWQGGKHWSELIADNAIEFIDDSQNFKDPFFLYLAFNAPHDPRQSPKNF